MFSSSLEYGFYYEYTGSEKILTAPEDLTYFHGDGDFRSEESIALLKQSAIVVTNPSFSLFREYIAKLMHYRKKFLVISSINAITYKDIFTLIQAKKIWLGGNFGRLLADYDGAVGVSKNLNQAQKNYPQISQRVIITKTL